ncbi:4-diphosphocytidyl-2-C-methyl-D-erythritol kinase, putative [Plasmodium gallinaceum]|uniref:4-diphosphocytidyl-2-C-methyl-D-erythritol kinase, putative n=1 Tax=Plasmodium gallinaceum TaxID=5849 RepID=A0A1J1GZU3_PLAGA|nr:4-diphosphocytidyl-2-C-methyl-D-erythritol kinase, putative [Plasmodium gallinaceum]CRG97808.1 4-diphosphocytidyl-2-C-methyl-D-erythritol kinase, putative [Plasmodium gallinaceum]
MKFSININTFVFLYINLVFFNMAHKNVFNKDSKVIKSKMKNSKRKISNIYFITQNKKINNKLTLRKNRKSNYLNQNTNYEVKENINLDIDQNINNNEAFYKKENVLCNKKMKLILQVLNRTKWFDFKFFSPAKINLFLRLKEKKDGYNEISTLMHSINLGDDLFVTILNKENQKKLRNLLHQCSSGDFLTIKKSKKCKIKHKNTYTKKEKDLYYNNYPLNDDNIIIKILKKYREELNINDDIKFLVHANKRIPIFGGLGGGSSDGATIFYFLEKYFYKYLKLNTLKSDFLKKIGSDISFFDSSGFAYCTGKGNDIIDLKNVFSDIIKDRIYLFQFNEGLSSKLVYENVDYNKIIQYNPVDLLENIINSNNNITEIIKEKEKKYMKSFVKIESKDLHKIFINDLEHSAFFLAKKLKEIKKILVDQNIFQVVTMSGSGSTLFAIPKNNINLDLEKIQIKNLIEHIQEKLNVKIKIYLCNILRKNEKIWYKPKKIAEVIK